MNEEQWKYKAHGLMNELELAKIKYHNLEKKMRAEG